MILKGPRAVGDLLQSGDMARLTREAAERRQLAAELRSRLPADEAAHLVSAHIDADGAVVIGMDSAAWAARLRYAAPELIGQPFRVRVTAPGGTSD
jgi:hypothetical protein